jgi:hypothetical protein
MKSPSLSPSRKSPSRPFPIAAPAILLALFAAGGVVARALGLPFPAALVGLGLVLLALRVGVMVAAVQDPAGPARPIRPRADDQGPALRAANG